MPALQQVVNWLEDQAARSSLVGDRVFFDPAQFPWVQSLEENWQVIRQELDVVLQHTADLPNYQDISPRQQNISPDNLWKTYFFYAFGLKAEQNCAQCPETARLLQRVPGLKVAFFSILAPQKQIPEHRGKHKGVLRYHLGLKIPQPITSCGIRINGEVAHWEEGKSLIFDDTFLHAAWNHSDDYRVVLFLDVARPLSFPMSLVNWAVNQGIALSPMIRESKHHHAEWEKRFSDLIK